MRRRWRVGRRWWLVVVQALLTAVAAYGFSVMQVPVYEATAVVFVSAQSTQITPLDLTPVRQDYAAYLFSTYRAQAVVDELRLDLPATALLAAGEIRAGTEASTVEITVENSDREVAAAIARAWGRQLVALRRLENADLPAEQQIDAALLDRVSVQLARPHPWLNALGGLFLGAATGVALLLWLAWRDGAWVRDGADVEAVLGVPVVGRIPGGG